MVDVDRESKVVFRLGPLGADVPGFPFHAVCAKWLDAHFRDKGVALACLARYLLFTSPGYFFIWTGDHLNCPDDADIQKTQLQFPRVERWQYYVLARPDSIWWDPDTGGASIESLVNQILNEEKDEQADDENQPDRYNKENGGLFDGNVTSLLALKRGTYEGAAELVPLPTVSHPTDDRAAAAAAAATTTTRNTSLSLAPDRLPHDLVTTLLVHLPVARKTAGALALLSSSRAWFHFGRSTAWRSFCVRDGFARVPTQSVGESLAEYESRGVDWKRVYFCYESRNARRIARNLGFLAERARRVQTRGVDEDWKLPGRNPLAEVAANPEESEER